MTWRRALIVWVALSFVVGPLVGRVCGSADRTRLCASPGGNGPIEYSAGGD